MAVSTLELEPLRRVPPPGKVSFEEFIEWCEPGIRAEWVDGEIEIMASPVSLGHQYAGGFLYKLLSIYVEQRDLGQVLLAPYVMRMRDISRGREPDLIFVRQDRVVLLTRHYLDGPADLAVEVISPESVRRDRKIKFKEYESAGVREYWLIDPDHKKAEFYQLDDSGQYKQVKPSAGVYRSQAVAGFWLRVSWVWQPPTVLDALRELQVA